MFHIQMKDRPLFSSRKRARNLNKEKLNANKVKSNWNPIGCANTGAANQQQTSPTGGKNVHFFVLILNKPLGGPKDRKPS